MDHNQLEVLDTRALPPLLEALDLSFNRIYDVKYGFNKFRNLELLILSFNKIKAILPDFSNPIDNPSLSDMYVFLINIHTFFTFLFILFLFHFYLKY